MINFSGERNTGTSGRFVITTAVLLATLITPPAWSQSSDPQADPPSSQVQGQRGFRPGTWSRLDELPRGRFRTRFERLAPHAQQRGLDALRKLHFPEQDLIDSLQVDDGGGIYYADTFPVPPPSESPLPSPGPSVAASSLPVTPFPADLNFHSRPGSQNVVYLDFDGGTVTGTAWNSSYGRSTFFAVAFDLDGDTTTFSDGEQAAIKEIWQRVAEDYAPFDVNVTTQQPATFSIRTLHVLATNSTDANGNANPSDTSGGIAYVNIFNTSTISSYRPAWCYVNNLARSPAYIAECASHEIGHNLSLTHDGLTTGAAYYYGHGTGDTSWAPIMGASYYASVTEWSKGQYYNANNSQDDLAALSSRLGYRPDDHGNTPQTATPLAFTDGAVVATTPENDPANLNPANKGVLSTSTDVDVFAFIWFGGSFNLAVNPWAVPNAIRPGANLDILLELRDSSGTLVAGANPANRTGAEIQMNDLTAGVYYLYVRNTGVGDPLSSSPDGYTSYGSIGQYFVEIARSGSDVGGSKIAFESNRDGNYEIYVMNADGSNATRLTNHVGSDRGPAWSPDGTRIAFTSNRNGNNEIYVMNADGSNPTRLTNNAASDSEPAWSPFDNKIVFTSNRDGNSEIYVMNADGSNPTRFTSNTETDESPRWSPDGTRIAFTSNRNGNNEIYVMNANGSNQTGLTNRGGVGRYHPRWAPDSARIVYVDNYTDVPQVYVMNADGSQTTRLTDDTAEEDDPAWSADGRSIAFRSRRDGNYEIYVMNADGSNPTRLTISTGSEGAPDWQPTAPVNDAQGDAIEVGQGQYRGVLALATADGASMCGAIGQADIWYRFKAPMTGVLHTDTCGSNDLGGTDTGTDTVLSLHSADGLTELGCNDDWDASGVPACPSGPDAGSPRDSNVGLSISADQEILIRVTRYSELSQAKNILLNVAFEADSDVDGIVDGLDNCTMVANPAQVDSDGDGYGNHCDGDLNNNGLTNAQDYVLFRAQLGQPSVAPAYNPADLNGSGFVNAQDHVMFRQLLGSPPGPSGQAP